MKRSGAIACFGISMFVAGVAHATDIEIAYREIGEVLFRLAPVEGTPEFGPCDD